MGLRPTACCGCCCCCWAVIAAGLVMMVVMTVVVVVVVILIVVVVILVMMVVVVVVVLGGGVSLESCRVNTGRFAVTRYGIYRVFHVKQKQMSQLIEHCSNLHMFFFSKTHIT